MATRTGPNDDYVVQQSPNNGVSSITWSPTNNMFVAGSWNKEVRLWDVQANGQAIPKAMTSHEAPVLSTAWAGDGQRVFSGSCDTTIKMWNIATSQSQTIGKHDAPVKSVHWMNDLNLVVSGSWDKTIKYWDLRSPNPTATVQLPERVYAMDVVHPLVVVALAERQILIFDMAKPTTPYRQFVSTLRYQTRCIRAFPDKTGFAIGSIEGRVSISHVQEGDKTGNFAFKCHRHNQEVFAVNCLSFHPRYGTFATAGSDGAYVFWDKDSKQRLRLFNRNPQPISATNFNRDGSIYAYAVSYDWSKGVEHYDKNQQNNIFLHAVQDSEIQHRPKK